MNAGSRLVEKSGMPKALRIPDMCVKCDHSEFETSHKGNRFLYCNRYEAACFTVTRNCKLNENPEAYKGKKLIVIADIKSVVEAPEAFLNKKIELMGYVMLDGFRKTNDWSFILKDEKDRQVRCYEREYRITSWIMPEMALRQANQGKEKVTVVGKFEKNGKFELDWIEYKGQHFNTDYKPPEVRVPFF